MIQIIDKKTGSIYLTENFSISPNTNTQELIAIVSKEKIEAMDVGGGTIQYKIRNFQINDHFFLFDFYFHKNHLRFLTFILSDKPIVSGSWNNWTEKEERENKKRYDKWLTTQLGSYRKFNWGTIEALYSPQTGGSSIALNYLDRQGE